MVVKPTVPKEDRDEVLHRACSRLSAKVTAYPACRPGLVVGHRWENEDMMLSERDLSVVRDALYRLSGDPEGRGGSFPAEEYRRVVALLED